MKGIGIVKRIGCAEEGAGLTFTPDEAIAGSWGVVWDFISGRSDGLMRAGQ